MKIKLLDLCCKAGGASMGYYQAANDLGYEIEITGIDIELQPNYPFQFIHADAVDFLQNNYADYTHIHASPPCQMYSNSTANHRMKGKVYNDNLIEIVDFMKNINLPGVIENVMPAPIPGDIVLRGDMFGLQILKKRKFHTVNWFQLAPIIPQKKGSVKAGDFAQVVGNGQLKPSKCESVKIEGNVQDVWSKAIGINWMTKREMAEAIPPAFTRYIGLSFFNKR